MRVGVLIHFRFDFLSFFINNTVLKITRKSLIFNFLRFTARWNHQKKFHFLKKKFVNFETFSVDFLNTVLTLKYV